MSASRTYLALWPMAVKIASMASCCLADTSQLLYPSCSVMELESETRLAVMLILPLGGHSGFRVTGIGQVYVRDEVQTFAQCQLDPVPTDFHIALAPKPMGVNPAALALLDHLGALGDEIERRHGQYQAQPRERLC